MNRAIDEAQNAVPCFYSSHRRRARAVPPEGSRRSAIVGMGEPAGNGKRKSRIRARSTVALSKGTAPPFTVKCRQRLCGLMQVQAPSVTVQVQIPPGSVEARESGRCRCPPAGRCLREGGNATVRYDAPGPGGSGRVRGTDPVFAKTLKSSTECQRAAQRHRRRRIQGRFPNHDADQHGRLQPVWCSTAMRAGAVEAAAVVVAVHQSLSSPLLSRFPFSSSSHFQLA